MTIDGKQQQFTEVYERESDALFRFALLRTSSREQAFDIVQESFSELWLALRRGTAVENCRAFLFTVARHKIIDWYRKAKSYSLDAIIEDESGGGNDFADDRAFREIESSVEARRIAEAIRELPEAYRDAVALRLLEDVPPQEIALILGITRNAASVRVTRGIHELRKRLRIAQNETERAEL